MPTLRKITMPKPEQIPLKLDDLIGMLDSNYTKYSEIQTNIEENERKRRAKHWADDKVSEIEGQGRQAYSIAFLTQKENQVLSDFEANKTEFKVVSKIDPNDEIKAEIANVQFRDLEDRVEFQDIESDVTDDGLTISHGVYKIGLGSDAEGNTVPIIESKDYKDIIWDYNSRKYDHEDGLFEGEIKRAYRYQLVDDFGKEAGQITEDNGFFQRFGRAPSTFYVRKATNGKSDFDIINVFHLYIKVKRLIYYVYFNDYLNLNGLLNRHLALKTSNKEEAERTLRELMLPYIQGSLPRGKAQIDERWEDRVNLYKFTYQKVLEFEETELPFYPYCIFHSFFQRGYFWTLTDILKDIQTFVDRYIAQIDYSLGKDIKDTIAMDVMRLAEGQTPTEVLRQLEEDGVIFTKGSPNDVVKNLSGSGANPQYLQMVEWMKIALEDLAGGRAFQGLSEGSREPGIAVQLKKEQGSKLAYISLKNASRTKRQLGKKLLWYFKNYDTAERVIKVGGGELSPQMIQLLQSNGIYAPSPNTPGRGYLKVNTMFHLKDAELELKVIESARSETMKEKKLGQLALHAQIDPLWNQVPAYHEELMKVSDIDFDTRQRLIQGYMGVLQAQAAAAKAESDREDAKVNIDRAKVVADLEKADKQSKAKSGKTDKSN